MTQRDMEGEGVRDSDRSYDYASCVRWSEGKEACACPSVCVFMCAGAFMCVRARVCVCVYISSLA